MANSPFINSVYINLNTALQSASGILKSENVVSMSNKFPSHRFLFSYLNDNVFAIGPGYIFG